jgi:lipid-A-disaccharide synthase
MSVSGDPAGPLIFLIAGEPSGDALGAALMAALRARTGGRVRFVGVGGDRMTQQGLQSLVPIQDLAVMGLAEILPRARLILRRIGETAAAVATLNPDAVVTIDSFGFNSRVARRLWRRGARVPLIHYSAPHVWAWRHGRARRMAQLYDHVMALLPFEPPYFAAVGLACTYVGHPVVEAGADRGDGAAFRARQGFDRDRLVLAMLPGSRRGEVRRLLPIFRSVLELLLVRYPGLAVVVPTIGSVAREVAAAIKDWPGNPIVVLDAKEKFDAFAASDLAIAASGTVALELALAGVPMIVTYQVAPATAYLVRRMATVRFANLINLVLDRPAIPELLQEDCTSGKIATAAIRLIEDPSARESQCAALADGLAQLGVGGISPSLRAADCVLAVIAERRVAA